MKVRLLLLFILLSGELCAQQNESVAVSFTTEPSAVSLYWKDSDGVILRSLQNLKTFFESQGKQLRFGMNAGMYMRDNSPQGLFIENGTQHTKLDTASGSGNFISNQTVFSTSLTINWQAFAKRKILILPILSLPRSRGRCC